MCGERKRHGRGSDPDVPRCQRQGAAELDRGENGERECERAGSARRGDDRRRCQQPCARRQHDPARDAQRAELVAERHGDTERQYGRGSACRSREPQDTRPETGNRHGCQAEDSGAGRRCDRPGRLSRSCPATEKRQPHAASDPSGREGLDERADAVARDGVKPTELAPRRAQRRAPCKTGEGECACNPSTASAKSVGSVSRSCARSC